MHISFYLVLSKYLALINLIGQIWKKLLQLSPVSPMQFWDALSRLVDPLYITYVYDMYNQWGN